MTKVVTGLGNGTKDFSANKITIIMNTSHKQIDTFLINLLLMNVNRVNLGKSNWLEVIKLLPDSLQIKKIERNGSSYLLNLHSFAR